MYTNIESAKLVFMQPNRIHKYKILVSVYCIQNKETFKINPC